MCFLVRGCTTACLKTVGTQPEVREVFTKVKMHGPTVLKTSFSSLGGILSRGYCEGLSFWTTLDNSVRDTGSNCSKTAGHRGDTVGSKMEGDGEDLMAETLSIKNARNFSYRVGDGSTHREYRGLGDR